LAVHQTRRRNYKGHPHILVVHEKGVAVVSLVLAERLAMIAEDDPQCVLGNSPVT
jgi:hypothetical protein